MKKYFAYGSNMNPERMKLRGINYSQRKPATLKAWKLKFNKAASKNPEEGYANIVLNVNGTVEGILYEIDDPDLSKLDKYEGYPDHYCRILVKVLLNDGQKVEAITYVANSNKIRNGLRPSKEYLSHLLKGCDLLSEKYCKRLKEWETLD